MHTGLYFARILRHPKTGQRLKGVAVMKTEAVEIGGPPTRFCIFVSQHADLSAAMAEVRRLNGRVDT